MLIPADLRISCLVNVIRYDLGTHSMYRIVVLGLQKHIRSRDFRQKRLGFGQKPAKLQHAFARFTMRDGFLALIAFQKVRFVALYDAFQRRKAN